MYGAIAALMPANASAENLTFRYDYDPALGFLGGPYSPRVSVEITGLDFEFVTPLGGLARLATARASVDAPARLAFPSMNTSLPAETLITGDTT